MAVRKTAFSVEFINSLSRNMQIEFARQAKEKGKKESEAQERKEERKKQISIINRLSCRVANWRKLGNFSRRGPLTKKKTKCSSLLFVHLRGEMREFLFAVKIFAARR